MLNPIFPNHEVETEDEILDDLIIESIQMHGRDIYYLPRTGVNHDAVLNEDRFADFNTARVIEIYINSFEGFEGNGQMLSKFGLKAEDELTVTLSKTRFIDVLGDLRPNGPQDGDLIYLPMTGNLWEVNYSSSRKPAFYQLGQLRMYQLSLGLIQYDNQVFRTGVEEIDSKYNALSTNVNQTDIPDDELIADLFNDSTTLQEEGDDILDFSNNSPLADGDL